LVKLIPFFHGFLNCNLNPVKKVILKTVYKMKKLIIYFLLVLALPISLKSQTIKTVGSVSGYYTSLKDAFYDINLGYIQGAITLEIIENTAESESAILNASGSGSANYSSVTIYPTSAGLTISDDGSWDGPLILLNGADNVTIDGRLNPYGSTVDLTLLNTSTSNTTGVSTISFENDATNNTVKYTNIKGASTAITGGILFFGTTTGTTGNDGNIIDNNNITNSADADRPVNAIYSLGTTGKDNSGNTISNNKIKDFLNKGLGSNGIYLDAFNSAWTITVNSFYETTSFVPTAPVDYNIIQINNSGINYSVTGNYIGGQAPFCGGSTAWTKTNAFDNAFTGININAGTGTATSLQSNTIQNFAWSNSGSASWTGINIASGDVNVGTGTGNTIGASTGMGSITITGGATNTNIYGINISGGGAVNCQNNNIGSIVAANGTANASNFYGINKTATTGTTTISKNIVGSTTTGLSINASSASSGDLQIVYGISNAGTENVTISGNTIANLTNGTTNTSGSIAGVYFNGVTGTNAVSENFIHSLSAVSGSSTSSVYGIRMNNGAASYYNNIISLGGNTQTAIYGIYETGSAGSTNKLYFNTVYIGGSPTAGANNSYALYSAVNTNTRDIRNNIFDNSRSNSGTASGNHYGAYFVSTGGTITCDYNDYFTPGSGGILNYYGPPVVTLDLNSFTKDPLFPNPGGTTVNDYLGIETSLHGITGTGIGTDYNGAPRSLPAIGALEFGPCTNPTISGAIAADQSSCSSFDPVAFTSTLPASGHIGTALEYKWQISTTSSSTGFNDISSSNSDVYDPGLTTQTTWYRRLARVSCISNWTSPAISNVLTIAVNTPPVAGAITGGSAICMGGSLSLSANATGTPTLTYTWNSSNTGVATVTNAGLVTTVSAGSTNITYTVTDGGASACQATSPIHVLAVNALPVANPITGGNAVCMGSTLTLTPNATGTTPLSYTWSSSNTAVANVSNAGVVTPVSAGSTNIRYIVTDGSSTACQAQSSPYAVTVNALPVAGAITGGNDVCMGGTLALTSHATGTPVLTYLWNSSNTGVATVSNTGVVTTVSGGSTNITYTVTDGSTTSCQATSPINVVTVRQTVAGAITGGNAVCMGTTLTLSSHATGTPVLTYVWTSSNTGVATVSSTGVVTPVSVGSTNITYTVTDGSSTACQATSAINPVTVNALPVAGTITGGNAVCTGSTLALTSHATGTAILTYTWNSSNTGVATVANNGVVTPISAGSTNITYTVTDGSSSACQAISPFFSVTVNTKPVAGAITGGTAVCMGGTLSLTSHATGTPLLTYVWSSSNNTVATVSNSGVVTPVSPGTTNISYTVTDGSPTTCSSTSAVFPITINALPAINLVAGGTGTICSGTGTTITVALSAVGINYQLRNSSGNINVGAPVAGTGGTISLPTGNLTIATIFNILATNVSTTCSAVLTETEVITIDPTSSVGTLSGGTSPVTYGGSTGTLTISGYTGTILKWQKMVGTGSWQDIANTTATFTEAPQSVGTWQYRVAIQSGICPIAFTTPLTTIVLPKAMTITAKNQAKFYGSTFTFVGTEFTSSGLINSDAVTSVSLTSAGAAATANVATSPYIITAGAATGTGLGNYTISYVNGSLSVSKSDLVVSANPQFKVYGTVNQALTFLYNGWQNGEDESVLTVKPVATTTVNTSSAAGVYTGAITVSGGSDDNYSFTYNPADFTITKANQTITFGTLPSVIYGQADFSAVATASSGLTVSYSSDNLAVATITAGVVHITGAGTAVITVSQSGNGNYNPAPAAPQTLTVSKANLTFKATDKSKAYLASNPVLTYIISGYVNSETQTVLDALPVIQTTALQNSNAGSYPISISGGSDNNYNYIYVSGTLSITKISQTITFSDFPEKLRVDETYPLVATSTSGLTVLFESTNTALATISGNILKGVSKGDVRVRAYHPGDQNYTAAEAFKTIKIYSTHKDIMHLFTPNNDGINDQWELPDKSAWGKCDVKVYNRWGKLVFADPDYNNQWEGISNGSPLPEGAYYFIIKTENEGEQKGTVNIVR
jgi:gliding motility-associated-like protein